MKAKNALKIFREAVEKQGFKFVSDFEIEKGDYRFKYYNCYSDDTGFVGVEIKSEYSFFEYENYGNIETLKYLKMRLGL